jgi:hypothetical protein
VKLSVAVLAELLLWSELVPLPCEQTNKQAASTGVGPDCPGPRGEVDLDLVSRRLFTIRTTWYFATTGVTTLTVVHTALFSQRGNLTEKRHEKAIDSDIR